MEDRIAAARRNLTAAEASSDWGQVAAHRAEIVRLSRTPIERTEPVTGAARPTNTQSKPAVKEQD